MKRSEKLAEGYVVGCECLNDCWCREAFTAGYQAAIDELRSEEAKGLVRTTDLNPLEGADWADWLDGYEK